MSLQPGDRVRWETTGDDGLPLVRYGFVGGSNGDGSRVAVMLDSELKGHHLVDLDQLEAVTVTNVELRLRGTDLLDDPSLRGGLVSLWSAEADQAGLEICSVDHLDVAGPTGVNGTHGVEGTAGTRELILAEILAGGRTYVLQAAPDAAALGMVRVRAVLPPA